MADIPRREHSKSARGTETFFIRSRAQVHLSENSRNLKLLMRYEEDFRFNWTRRALSVTTASKRCSPLWRIEPECLRMPRGWLEESIIML
jgi:hypothetical protein